jgi:hypothetical protein
MDEFVKKFQEDVTKTIVAEAIDSSINITMTSKNMKRNISVGHDSKLVSKILESFVIQILIEYCESHQIRFQKNDVQNKYPDFIIFYNNQPIAMDVKTSYLIKNNVISGFTLGTYNGYFRNRQSTKNTVFPYESYGANICICIIYERVLEDVDIKYCVCRPKWMLASRRAGSGNTANVGSVKSVDDILNSKSCFNSNVEFDEYWTSYG